MAHFERMAVLIQGQMSLKSLKFFGEVLLNLRFSQESGGRSIHGIGCLGPTASALISGHRAAIDKELSGKPQSINPF
jgi:hypothetical protein